MGGHSYSCINWWWSWSGWRVSLGQQSGCQVQPAISRRVSTKSNLQQLDLKWFRHPVQWSLMVHFEVIFCWQGVFGVRFSSQRTMLWLENQRIISYSWNIESSSPQPNKHSIPPGIRRIQANKPNKSRLNNLHIGHTSKWCIDHPHSSLNHSHDQLKPYPVHRWCNWVAICYIGNTLDHTWNRCLNLIVHSLAGKLNSSSRQHRWCSQGDKPNNVPCSWVYIQNHMNYSL